MNRKIVRASAILFAAALTCTAYAKPKKAANIDPEAAVRALAPVERRASLPGEGVYYSLFVRSFADGNGDGIGDFKGLIKRLDYLNDGNDATTSDLGVTGIWLLPIFESPSYHGYDVVNYYSINQEYGTMADFKKFIAECQKRGISVMLDMTCNGSSDYNSWFVASKDPKSPFRTWYRWLTDLDFTDEGGVYYRNQKGLGGNIWVNDLSAPPIVDDNGNNVLDSQGRPVMSYYAGLYSTSLPDFNMDEQAVREEFKKVFTFWMDKGVSGFRFDSASHIYNVAKVQPGSETLSKAVAFWKEMNAYIWEENPNAYSVAEVWESTAIRVKYLGGMQSNFNFDIGNQIKLCINNQEINDNQGYVEADKSVFNGFARTLEAQYKQYASVNPNYIDAPFLTNHDQARSSTAFFQNRLPKMKLAADLYILAEGVPFIYYGEEIAMKSGTDDPSKRTPLIWKAGGKDSLQTKQLETGVYAGGAIYNKKTLSIDEMQKDPDSLLNHYKRVIRVKTAHPALYKGRLKAVSCDSPFTESWVMECDEEKAFVVHNLSSKETVTVAVPEGCVMPLVYAANPAAKLEGETLTIPPMSSVVLAEWRKIR